MKEDSWKILRQIEIANATTKPCFFTIFSFQTFIFPKFMKIKFFNKFPFEGNIIKK